MQTTTYGSKQQKSTPINTSAYQAPVAPLAALYGVKTSSPFADRASTILANSRKLTSAVPGLTGTGTAAGTSPLTAAPKPGPIGAQPPASLTSGQSTIGAGASFAPPNINDLTLDPVYQQVVAAGQRNIADADTAALASAKNALLGYGAIAPSASSQLSALFQNDPNNPILGALSDTLTEQAAAKNPNATLNQLALNDQQRVGQLDSDLNNQNLYYSSTRAAQLANDANTYRNEQASATNDLADALSQIYGNVLNTKQQALEDQNNALQQAYQNALQLAALGGGAPPQGGQQTNGPGGPTSVNTGGGNTTLQQPFAAYPSPLQLAQRSAPLQQLIAARI